jgi:glycosyltransferase involved in cell wall biosynthesis
VSSVPEHGRRAGGAGGVWSDRPAHAVIVVQNLPVPIDRRVWSEATTLREAGYRVTVLCPAGPGDPPDRMEDGVRVVTFPLPSGGAGMAAFALECGRALAAVSRRLARLHREGPIDVLQVCNPPDTFAGLGWWLRRRGARFVFDQHDLCPEIYLSRPGRTRPMALRVLHVLERSTYRIADHVISPNESYAEVARERGGLAHRDVTVVRSGPDPARWRRSADRPELRRGRRHLVAYLGIMGPQDRVDLLVRAAAHLVFERGRTDTTFALLGFGDCEAELRRLAHDLGLDEWLTFTGRADIDVIGAYLSTADVGVAPDPKTPFNDVSTMNKVLEYMAFGLPVVGFDLRETAVSAGPAAVLVPDGSVEHLAAAIADLLDDPDRRRRLGALGRARIEGGLGWPAQAERYRTLYDSLTARPWQGADRATPAEQLAR